MKIDESILNRDINYEILSMHKTDNGIILFIEENEEHEIIEISYTNEEIDLAIKLLNKHLEKDNYINAALAHDEVILFNELKNNLAKIYHIPLMLLFSTGVMGYMLLKNLNSNITSLFGCISLGTFFYLINYHLKTVGLLAESADTQKILEESYIFNNQLYNGMISELNYARKRVKER